MSPPRQFRQIPPPQNLVPEGVYIGCMTRLLCTLMALPIARIDPLDLRRHRPVRDADASQVRSAIRRTFPAMSGAEQSHTSHPLHVVPVEVYLVTIGQEYLGL